MSGLRVPMVDAGTVLLNKYRIERVLGQGGMGVVALARHLQLNQPVAIKFLLPDVLDQHTVVQRFLREAQASVQLKSEHVCRVIDVGTLETGAPYMVMEYLEGLDLDELLKERGPLAPGTAVDFVLQACEALAEAHALGIVHRDLKPANFFLTRRADGSPLIKVLDFGISKAAAHLDDHLTTTQSILGTPAYMSPEQLKASKYVDARADIWSLGVVLYELLVGRRPFSASTFSELVLKVAIEPAPPPPLPLPPGLAESLLRCLHKEPGERFGSVAELAAALAPFAETPAIATSAVERSARILRNAAGAGGRGQRPGTSEPGASFHSAVTAPERPQRPDRPRDLRGELGSLSTISASGEIVRSGSVEVAERGGPLGPGPRRRTALYAGLAAVVVIAGVAIVVLSLGGPRTRGGGPALPAAAADDAAGAAVRATAPPPASAPLTPTPSSAVADPVVADPVVADPVAADPVAAAAAAAAAALPGAAVIGSPAPGAPPRASGKSVHKRHRGDAARGAGKAPTALGDGSDDDILGSRH